jgi:hypothetical protein
LVPGSSSIHLFIKTCKIFGVIHTSPTTTNNLTLAASVSFVLDDLDNEKTYNIQLNCPNFRELAKEHLC